VYEVFGVVIKELQTRRYITNNTRPAMTKQIDYEELDRQLTKEVKEICAEILGEDPDDCNYTDYYHGLYDTEEEARADAFENDVWGIAGPDRVHVAKSDFGGFHAFTF
jgi:hypothetical protein